MQKGATTSVDGIALGEAHERDRQGRLLPVWQGYRVIADGDVVLMNREPLDSLDGRYFGMLPVIAIFAEAELVWSSGER